MPEDNESILSLIGKALNGNIPLKPEQFMAL
jgi:hypothetical protein